MGAAPFEWRPHVLMADGATAVDKAVAMVFNCKERGGARGTGEGVILARLGGRWRAFFEEFAIVGTDYTI